MTELTVFSAFVIGLLGGVHCIGMCGGIVGALSLGVQHQARGVLLTGYHLGRLSSYMLAGGIAGGIGYFVAETLAWQQVLMQVAAVFMVLLGCYLAGWWQILTLVERLGGGLWRRIEPLGRGLLPVKDFRQALLIGLLWGWLPCGLVYSMLLWSVSAGNIWQGGALMLAFGLGTLPNLLLIGAAAHRLRRWVNDPRIRQWAGGLVVVYGVYLLGLSLV